jgi:hypothetical protein
MNRLLGTTDDRITGKPETIPKCLTSLDRGKFARTSPQMNVLTAIPVNEMVRRLIFERVVEDRVGRFKEGLSTCRFVRLVSILARPPFTL